MTLGERLRTADKTRSYASFVADAALGNCPQGADAAYFNHLAAEALAHVRDALTREKIAEAITETWIASADATEVTAEALADAVIKLLDAAGT